MNTAIIGIGSNIPEAQEKIRAALDALSACGTVVAVSDVYVVSQPYLNVVLRLDTVVDYDSLSGIAKDIELCLGRTPHARRCGLVPVDIDVVIFNGEVRRERDFTQEYFRRGYAMIGTEIC